MAAISDSFLGFQSVTKFLRLCCNYPVLRSDTLQKTLYSGILISMLVLIQELPLLEQTELESKLVHGRNALTR